MSKIVLADSVVKKGRLAGTKLENGSFLSPEVSFNGKEILFAFSETKAWSKYQGKEAYEWSPEISLPHLQMQRRRLGAGPTDGRTLERLRSLLFA